MKPICMKSAHIGGALIIPRTLNQAPIETKTSSYRNWTQVGECGYGYGGVLHALLESNLKGLESLQQKNPLTIEQGTNSQSLPMVFPQSQPTQPSTKNSYSRESTSTSTPKSSPTSTRLILALGVMERIGGNRAR